MDNRLETLLTLTSAESVCRYMEAHLERYNRIITQPGCYSYFVGTLPVCLVAHADTVPIESVEPIVERRIVRNKHLQPLGADDRAGCYAILALHDSIQIGCPLPSVLITCGEETGGTGVKAWLKDQVWVGDDLLFIELDRAGANEYVSYYGDLPVEVEDYIESFGFRQKVGSYSDIADIAEKLLAPCVNLSVGYYNQHSQLERLHLDELDLTIARVAAMLLDPIDKLYELDPVVYSQWDKSAYLFANGYTSSARGKPANGNGKAKVLEPMFGSIKWVRCGECGTYEAESKLVATEEGLLVCEDCLNELDVCDVCGDYGAYETIHGDLLCEDCLERYGYDETTGLQELQAIRGH